MKYHPDSHPPAGPMDVDAEPRQNAAAGTRRDEPEREANPDDEDAGFDSMGMGESDLDPDDDREEDYP